MEFVSDKPQFNFMRYRYFWVFISLAMLALSLFVWIQKGQNKYGLDFSGGVELVGRFEKPINISDLRNRLELGGYSGAVVQAFEDGGSDFSIRLKSEGDPNLGDKIISALSKIEGNKFELLSEDYVGPIIGEQIRKQGLNALGLALVMILIYVSFRFEWRFAIGAVIALIHDVTITAGIFVFSGKEVSAAVLAALLTIIGYSINDTIIIYDRVRENLNLALKKGAENKKYVQDKFNLINLINRSINETLSRTIITSGTTFFVVVALWLLGGGSLVDLSFTLVIGLIVGTYSTIFVACPIVIFLAGSSKKE